MCFAIFGKNSKNQNGRHFWGGENFLKIAKSTFLRYPVGRKFQRNRSISDGLGDMSTFAFFSIQNSQLLIYLINYSLIYEAIPPKSNPIQAINPMNLKSSKVAITQLAIELSSPKAIPYKLLSPINLHAKFGKDRIRTVA